MQLVVMCFVFEVEDGLLPIGHQYVTIVTVQALVDLLPFQLLLSSRGCDIWEALTLAQVP